MTLNGSNDRRGWDKIGIEPRAAGRPTRRASAVLFETILDVAQRLFLEQGFEATSLNQIAAAAGVTKRTLYVKVGDKAELFSAVVRRLLAQRQEKLTETAATGSVQERLIRFGKQSLSNALDIEVLRLYRVVVPEAPRFPELSIAMEEQMAHGTHERLAALLRDEVQRGRLVIDNPRIAAQMLLAMFQMD